METAEECWKRSYVDKWEVSSLGRVRNRKTKRILQPYIHNGYYAIGCNTGPYRREKVHRLVCVAFHGIPPSGHSVDHMNAERLDNRSCNLRWCLAEENSSKRNRTMEEFRMRAQKGPSGTPTGNQHHANRSQGDFMH